MAGVQYLKNGVPVSAVLCGDVISFDVPGYSKVWLTQYQSGKIQFDGPFNLPMPDYRLVCDRDIGNFSATVYALNADGSHGDYLGNAFLTVGANPNAGVVSTTPTQPNTTSLTTAQSSAVAAALAPSQTPGTSVASGGLPTGQIVGQSGTAFLSTLYRFILQSGPNRFDTGANYPGCSEVNTAMCDSKQFSTLQAAIDYANSRGEIPYIVHSAAEVWGIIAGTIPIDPSRVSSGSLSPTVLIAATLAAIFLLRR